MYRWYHGTECLYFEKKLIFVQVPSQDDHPRNPQARTTTETVLREAMQALVRVKAHMLVRIVVEITLSQKRLEIQPHRCNGETSGRCQHHSILRFQLDSDDCSADLHHNPRKHVGLHAHQRLHRLP